MSTVMQAMRDHVALQDKIFSTREVLHFGKRATVDTVLSRLVGAGVLRRLVPGVFVRASSPAKPSIKDIAEVKARAFGKRLVDDHGEFQKALKAKNIREEQPVFRVSGRSSKFLYQKTYIHLKSMAPRKIDLGDSKIAKFVRALWKLGEKHCYKRIDLISENIQADPSLFNQPVFGWLPTWLHEFIQDNQLPISLNPSRLNST